LNFEEFIEVKQAEQKPKEEHPKGFKPGVEWNGNKGNNNKRFSRSWRFRLGRVD